MSRPHPNVKTWIVLSAAALAAALGTAFTFALQTDPREARALRTRGAILAVTRGDEPLVLGTRWQKWLLHLFPNLQERIGGAVLRPSNVGKRSLVVWQNAGPANPFGGHPYSIAPLLCCDRGESLRTRVYSTNNHLVFLGTPRGNSIREFELSVYPRRGKEVRLRFDSETAGANSQPVFQVPNPAPGNYSKWHPGPRTQHTGSLEVTLARLLTGKRGGRDC